MKIFFDHKIFSLQSYGGPSRYFTNLVSKLNEIDSVNAKIYAPLHINYMLSSISKSNIGIANKIPFANFFNQSNNFKKSILKINNKINKYYEKKEKPEIIHTTYYEDGFPKNSRNLVVTVYDLIHEIFKKDYSKEYKFLPKKNILDKAQQIICISQSTKKDLINYYDIDEKKITVTYLSNNLTLDEKLFFKKKIKLPEKFFLYVGSRWKYKNFNQLLLSISINKNILKELDLVIFGGGKITSQEKEFIKRLNLNIDKIIQLDGDESLLKLLYRKAEFFIYPSKYEGFGIPILESFSQKCPVLCSNTSSFPEVAGKAAIFFDPNDELSISNSIDSIMTSKDLRKKLINEGSERLQKFSWTKCASETLNVYKKIR
tara:strand:- start:100 stop:1218 length:1119 start_codon:yes stop_codon:yes gene_type:complete